MDSLKPVFFILVLLVVFSFSQAVSVCIPSCTPAIKAQMKALAAGPPATDFSVDFPRCAIPVVDDKYAVPIGGGPAKFDALIRQAAEGAGLSEQLVVLKAIMLTESGGDPTVLFSNKNEKTGAITSYDLGLFQANNVHQGPYFPQFVFSTTPDFSNSFSAWCPQNNVKMGVRNFADCLAIHNGNANEAACCYNTGKACAKTDKGARYLRLFSQSLSSVYGVS